MNKFFVGVVHDFVGQQISFQIIPRHHARQVQKFAGLTLIGTQLFKLQGQAGKTKKALEEVASGKFTPEAIKDYNRLNMSLAETERKLGRLKKGMAGLAMVGAGVGIFNGLYDLEKAGAEQRHGEMLLVNQYPNDLDMVAKLQQAAMEARKRVPTTTSAENMESIAHFAGDIPKQLQPYAPAITQEMIVSSTQAGLISGKHLSPEDQRRIYKAVEARGQFWSDKDGNTVDYKSKFMDPAVSAKKFQEEYIGWMKAYAEHMGSITSEGIFQFVTKGGDEVRRMSLETMQGSMPPLMMALGPSMAGSFLFTMNRMLDKGKMGINNAKLLQKEGLYDGSHIIDPVKGTKHHMGEPGKVLAGGLKIPGLSQKQLDELEKDPISLAAELFAYEKKKHPGLDNEHLGTLVGGLFGNQRVDRGFGEMLANIPNSSWSKERWKAYNLQQRADNSIQNDPNSVLEHLNSSKKELMRTLGSPEVGVANTFFSNIANNLDRLNELAKAHSGITTGVEVGGGLLAAGSMIGGAFLAGSAVGTPLLGGILAALTAVGIAAAAAFGVDWQKFGDSVGNTLSKWGESSISAISKWGESSILAVSAWGKSVDTVMKDSWSYIGKAFSNTGSMISAKWAELLANDTTGALAVLEQLGQFLSSVWQK